MGGWAAGQLVGEEEVGWRGETKEKQGQAGGAGGSEGGEVQLSKNIQKKRRRSACF